MTRSLEERVAGDLLFAEGGSDFVYEESYDSKSIYLVEFSPEGEPIARYKVSVLLEQVE